jgi:hypothetical protein
MNYYYSLDKSFDRPSKNLSSTIYSLKNYDTQQTSYHEYKKMVKSSEIILYNFYLKTNQKYSDESKEFDLSIKNELVPLTMINLINECCIKISERIQCIYQYKINCFLLKSKFDDDSYDL